MDALILRQAQVSEPGVAVLISRHFELMRASSPEESCHVMPAGELADQADIVVAAEWNGRVMGIGALKLITPVRGEIKSMHTSTAARGKGIARRILRRLIDEADVLGIEQVSLETGSAKLFAPARALYLSEGFQDCSPFGGYREDPLSVFMTRAV